MTYIGILIAAAIIAFLAFFGWRGHFQSPTSVSKNTQAAMEEQGISASSYQGVLSNVRSKLGEATQIESGRLKDLEDLK
ncbi:MAG: hypothetical protein HZB36_06140 [Candidatus Omnitrophica bacterium]|nr:hypothetical protein [Candidatus Omnitrophota bacterium]